MLVGRALRLGQTFEVVAWEIVQLGSCHLGKYLMEVATWENILWESLFKYTSWYLYRERIAGFTQGQDDILRAKEALDLERETLNMDKKTLSNLRSEHSRLKDDFR